MKNYIICMDASADIDNELKLKEEVFCIPMQYSLNEVMKTSTGDETMDDIHEFYESQRNGELTVTSQITPFSYEEALKGFLKEGKDVLYLSLSSGLSSTFASSITASSSMEYPGKLYPVDSLGASGGIGIMLERAIINRNNGMSIEDNVTDLRFLARRMSHLFLVQNLMYLKRGGRVSAVTAAVGTALGVKPILYIDEEGKLVTASKKRGNKSACLDLLDRFVNLHDFSCKESIYIIHADNLELAEYLKEEVSKLVTDTPIKVHSLSPIIGAHTGPDMCAIVHIGKAK